MVLIKGQLELHLQITLAAEFKEGVDKRPLTGIILAPGPWFLYDCQGGLIYLTSFDCFEYLSYLI